MKKLLIPAVLLAAATSSYGALMTPDAGRLAGYTALFQDPFGVSSDGTYTTEPYPPGYQPAAFVESTRAWSGWTQNWGAGFSLASVYPDGLKHVLSANYDLNVEIVFLGETAGWWDDFGYQINGGAYQLLANSVQTVGGGANRDFGDYTTITLTPGQSLDLFVTGTGKSGNNPSFPTVGVNGGLYYTYNYTANLPDGSDNQSWWGTLTPITGDVFGNPYTIVAFEDININGSGRDNDYNDFIFAFRASYDERQAPVPEPSTYGLIGAATLLGFIGYRRFKKKV